VEKEATAGRGRVDSVRDAGEVDPSSGQFTNKLDKLADGST